MNDPMASLEAPDIAVGRGKIGGGTCLPLRSASMISFARFTTRLLTPAALAQTKPADELATPFSSWKRGVAPSCSLESGRWMAMRCA